MQKEKSLIFVEMIKQDQLRPVSQIAMVVMVIMDILGVAFKNCENFILYGYFSNWYIYMVMYSMVKFWVGPWGTPIINENI